MRVLAALCRVRKIMFQDGSALRRSACAIIVLLGMSIEAHARPSSYPGVTSFAGDRYGTSADLASDVVKAIKSGTGAKSRHRNHERGIGRPRAWCGWWLGHHLGMPFRHLWLARNWAGVGTNAAGPQVGAVVVWRHHVGIITGRQGSQWVVKSGNDGHAVRERARSIAGAIAFRRVGWSG